MCAWVDSRCNIAALETLSGRIKSEPFQCACVAFGARSHFSALVSLLAHIIYRYAHRAAAGSSLQSQRWAHIIWPLWCVCVCWCAQFHSALGCIVCKYNICYSIRTSHSFVRSFVLLLLLQMCHSPFGEIYKLSGMWHTMAIVLYINTVYAYSYVYASLFIFASLSLSGSSSEHLYCAIKLLRCSACVSVPSPALRLYINGTSVYLYI